MSAHLNNADKTSLIEFSPEADIFKKFRQKGPWRWIFAHILKGSNKYLIIILFITIILSSIISSGVMVVIGVAVSEFTQYNGLNLGYYSLIILLMGVSAPLLTLFSSIIREILAQRMERDSRKEFYTNLLGKSQSFHDLQRIGDIMARTSNDVRMLNFLISPAIGLIISTVSSLIVPVIYVFLYYPFELIITPIGFIILFLISLRNYISAIGPVTGRLRQEFGLMDATLTETLSGIEVVKSAAQESTEAEKYFKNIKNYRDAFVKEGYIEAKYLPLLILALAITIGLAHSIILYLQGRMNIGQIIGYIGLLTQLRFPTFISIFVFAIVRLAKSGAERILEIMNKETEIDENIEGISKKIEGFVKFDNVSFTYPNTQKPVLQNISFEIQAGQTVAIVGTTGSGKTTLTKLLSRLYDVSDGKILIDNVDIRDYTLKSLRAQISYIEQDVFLFSTSILENIAFGRTSSIEEITKVAKLAQAHDFIMALPDGYKSEVGERGVQLSGGERQRIAIARSFLTDTPLLVLDDSTSAIDSDTEDKIQRAMNTIRKGRTTFIITHRLSMIRWADLILILKSGRVVAQGTHDDLLKTSPEYQKIFVRKYDVDITDLCKESA